MRQNGSNWQHVSEVIDDLAARVGRLRPDHRNPHRFHEEKSEIEHDLRQLQRVLPDQSVYGCAERTSFPA